ncbi:MAG: DUF3422 domain-containing protein [Pseudomonadota bacterium]
MKPDKMAHFMDHPLRTQLNNELHARPFPKLKVGTTAVYLAVRRSSDPAERQTDRSHLIALLDHYGAPKPEPGATHYEGPVGQHHLKWEQHTEFATYTFFLEKLSERPFDPAEFDVFPSHWQAALPSARVSSAILRIMPRPETEAEIGDHLRNWFVAESLAAATVLDASAVIATDFRIDPAGHMRFAIFADPDAGRRRVGRIVQRLCDIEVYKSMSMLGFAMVKDFGPELNALDAKLGELTGAMRGKGEGVEETLHALLDVSVELEQLTAQTSYRFAATKAYEAIVNERVEVLRETRFMGRQGFYEFMMRRYEPAMRTVASSRDRLQAMSARAVRAADLLRTRVDVERSAQNQAILESMDRRSDLQLRLQRTVEGLSVVAVSYYAVSLLSYMIAPAAMPLGLSTTVLSALVTVPVVLLVWIFLRRLRHDDS